MKYGWKKYIVLLLALCLCAGTSMAETFYVKPDIDSPLSLRDEFTNEVLITIPANTPLEPDGTKSSDLFAYVAYGGYSGLVLWNYLTRTPPAESGSSGFAGTAPEAETPAAVSGTAAGSYSLRASGAVIQQAVKSNKGGGPEMTEMTVTAEDNVIITAKVPKGKKIDYWVFNGVRYDFLRSVKWLRMTKFDRSWTVEVVFTQSASETLRPIDDILAARTGKTLVAVVKKGELCHILKDTKGGGGWISSFDFTEDYSNRATGEPERGGQLTAKVRASIPRGKRVAGWKFDETQIYPAAEVNDFIVRTLDTSMTYEPIFSLKAPEPKPDIPVSPSEKKPRPDPEPDPDRPDPTHRNFVTKP